MNIKAENILLFLMKKLLYLSDDEVQSQQAAKCNLYVNIGLETFQYAVVDHVRDQLKVIAEYEIPQVKNQRDLIKAIENLPEAGKQFKYSFNKIKVSFDTFHYTFIPAELYLKEDEQHYGKFINPGADNDLLVNYIRSADIKNIVAIDPDLSVALNKIFHRPKIFNQATPFLEGIKKISGSNKISRLFIDVHQKHIQIAVFNNSKLAFYNIFDCLNADEFNYYLLSILDQLSVEAEQSDVILSGKISADDELHLRIAKYFKDIQFADSKILLKYPEKLEEVNSHTFFSLISLDVCE
jgi:hypothetical protein